METEDARSESPSSAPEMSVKIITDEDMVAWRQETAANPPTGPNVIISPLGDGSVQGYVCDKEAYESGAQDMLHVVKILEGHGVPCCMVDEGALIYYGTGRVMFEWKVCVPTEHVEEAAELFRARPENFEPFRPSALRRIDQLDHLYPRFKFARLRLFFTIVSSQARHLVCNPENIEYSLTGLPYPTLPMFAQALLDSMNWVDLDDLIDGMNLTLEWGTRNLDLTGTIDARWGGWKADMLNGGKADHDHVPAWCWNPPLRLASWTEMVSDDAKKARQGDKYSPAYETRFWKRGQKDPRLRKRAYC